MEVTEFNPEVYFAKDKFVHIRTSDLDFLKQAAERSPRCRARVCAHKNPEDRLHEMIVVAKNGIYFIPEKHIVKSESYHIIEGSADVVVFDEAGSLVTVVQLGTPLSGLPFYYRMFDHLYHTLIIRSPYLIYHETATGPFSKADTVIAPWAPAEGDLVGKKLFMENLETRVKDFLNHHEDQNASNRR